MGREVERWEVISYRVSVISMRAFMEGVLEEGAGLG
jgi:hypothetical protein